MRALPVVLAAQVEAMSNNSFTHWDIERTGTNFVLLLEIKSDFTADRHHMPANCMRTAKIA
jgi:hypothetical protein